MAASPEPLHVQRSLVHRFPTVELTLRLRTIPRRGRFDQLRRRRLPPDRVHRQRWHNLPGRPVREVRRRGYDRAAAGVLLPAGPASDSRPQLCGNQNFTWPDSLVDLRAGPQGSLREAAQRPHGLHGPVPEVPQRGSYDDVLQVLSGVLGPRPQIDRHEGRPPSFSVSIA